MSKISAGMAVVVILIIAAVVFVSCGDKSGIGLLGDYNGKLNFETRDVRNASAAARVIVEEGHRGRLEKEATTFPPKLLGLFPRSGQTVLTFRVPASQFNATMVDLDSEAVGTLLDREVRGSDEIEDRGDLTEIAAALQERLATSIAVDEGDAEALDAQEKLEQLTEDANFPVVVVHLHPSRSILGWYLWFTVNPGVWILIGFGVGFAWFRRPGRDKVSALVGPDDPRQNNPETSREVQDWGETM